MSASETRLSKPIAFWPSVYRPFQRLLKRLVKELFTTYLADGEAGATVEVKINFLRPTWHTRLRAEARTVQHGDTLSLLECNVCDADGRLVARAMATMMRLAKGAGEGRNAVYEG